MANVNSSLADSLISVRRVSKRFGGVVAADQVSFNAAIGEVLGIIGPNGAGKNTLLKIIAGETAPDQGDILFAGARLDLLPQHRVAFAGVALAHQIPKPFRHLTVVQNVQVGAMASESRRLLPSREHVAQILALTGLASKANTLAAFLGLLDLKRLELARALSISPRLLMLDEVGAGLIESELEQMITLIARIRDAGTTLIIVEHVESVIRELAARVIVLDWGQIIKTGTPDEIAVDPQVRALYLGSKSKTPSEGGPSPNALRPSKDRIGSGSLPQNELLRLERISAHYGGARALQRLDLTINYGEVVAVFGANGAGKTTLANIISGLKTPSEGRLIYKGREINNKPAHKRVALGIAHCHEGRRLFANLTVRENLDIGAYTPLARRAASRQREYVLRLFPKLRERQTQLAGTLSGGEQQMVALGRALMSSPSLLILDEASLGLAPNIADQILEVVDDIRQSGVAVLLVEQNVHRSLAVADKVYVLDRGLVSFVGSPEELRGEGMLWKVYFGSFRQQQAAQKQ